MNNACQSLNNVYKRIEINIFFFVKKNIAENEQGFKFSPLQSGKNIHNIT